MTVCRVMASSNAKQLTATQGRTAEGRTGVGRISPAGRRERPGMVPPAAR